MNDHDVAWPGTVLHPRVELARRLRERFDEIETAIVAHVRGLAATEGREDAEYREGLKAAVRGLIECGLDFLESGEPGPLPRAALAQARRAARNGVGVEVILRRYAAGERLLTEFVVDEGMLLFGPELRKVLASQRAQVDRAMATVAEEYVRERERLGASPARLVERRVRRLLDGGRADEAAGLEYEFENWHLGVIAVSTAPAALVRGLATKLRCQLLVVPRGERTVWAWFGSRSLSPVARLEEALPQEDAGVAVGEPRKGLDGWRLTHHEAQAAFQVMLHKPQRLTRASDVVLLAAILRDEALTRSLRETYMTPLDRHGSSGVVLRETLRAYLDAGRNAVTAAAALGIDRHTVQRRLRKVEETLGRFLPTCHAELEVALGLEELELESTSHRLGHSGDSGLLREP